MNLTLLALSILVLLVLLVLLEINNKIKKMAHEKKQKLISLEDKPFNVQRIIQYKINKNNQCITEVEWEQDFITKHDYMTMSEDPNSWLRRFNGDVKKVFYTNIYDKHQQIKKKMVLITWHTEWIELNQIWEGEIRDEFVTANNLQKYLKKK